MESGIQGNTRSRQDAATQNRLDSKAGSKKAATWAIGIIVVLGFGLSLAKADLGIWGWLVIAILLSAGASKLENPKVTLSSALRTMSWVIIATIIITSGFGQWTKKVVIGADDYFSCLADENQPKCEKVKKAETIAKFNTPNTSKGVERVLKTITIESDPVPHCGAGWVEMDFPPEAEFKVWWNYAAADFEWLIEGKDEWQTEYAPTVAKMRACSKNEAYDGDRMKVTFKGYDL